MTKAELLEELESLSNTVRDKRLTERQIEDASTRVQELKQVLDSDVELDPSRLRELKGLGKEIWRSMDVDEYIKQERDSWA
jgi:hypothetical protein